jgi:hypothetical protein
MLAKLREEYQIRKALTLFDFDGKKVFYSNAGYIVKTVWRDETGRGKIEFIEEMPCYDSTIPLQIADLKNPDENKDILAWVEKYDIPNTKVETYDIPNTKVEKYDIPYTKVENIGDKRLYLNDGKAVLRFYPLRLLASQLTRIKAVVPLWKAFVEKDIAAIRQLLSLSAPMEHREDDDKIFIEQIQLSGYPIEHTLNYGVTFRDFEHNEKTALQVAARVLSDAIVAGLTDFPLASKITVAWDDEYDDEKFFTFRHKAEPANGDVYSYAWNVILEDLSRSEKRRIWNYRRCVDCEAWEDLSKPNRRNSRWKRCDACIKERKKTKRQERLANKPDKRPRGRPAKKKRPS